jgi:hypothetical protein
VSQLHSSTKALGRLKKPSGAPRLGSLLSSTPLLFSILREEQAEEEEELQRSKTLSLPDATALLLSSTSASDSAVPLSTQTRGPPVSPRGNTGSGGGGGGADVGAEADVDHQQQQQPDTLFNPRDLKLLRNKDIACLIQVLSSLAALKPTRAAFHDSADDDDDSDDDDTVTRQQRQHGKDLSASEEEQRVALRNQRRPTADEPDDLSLDFGRLCSFYTEAAVRALLRYYADSIIELVFPDHPHVRLSAGLSHLRYSCIDYGVCHVCRVVVCRVCCVVSSQLSNLVMGDLPRYCRRLKRLTIVKCPSITKIGAQQNNNNNNKKT